ncbi:protein of unknown function [Klenkia soli]|uniref:DUF1707 domain-containing protein n=1 Tax=Klenkia soli TaxID=1052260 RepID=A0A1H0R7Z9_9ACTN|nr:DUF1707 domain-containing protein [Klenkia soli]SDP25611.1 protein of unknown function [Klenkia soli]
MPETTLRAADSDRATVAEVLGTAMKDGRLTVEEYDERLAAAYAARTHADLAVLTADLPVPRAAAAPAGGPTYGSCGGGDLRNAWRGYATVALVVWAVYLMSSLAGGFGYPWPVWVVGPWGAVLLARTLGTRGALARR